MDELNTWLEEHRSENRISPVSWTDLPDDLKIKLDNLARDEAVRRADEFASDQLLDLSRHDAVRHLVDAMAQAWTLPCENICSVVEDYIDELPPEPGHEFEKLIDKLFRRKVSIPWPELNKSIDRTKLASFTQTIVDTIVFPPKTVLDRGAYLNALKDTYDKWCSRNAAEAVKEVFEILGTGDKKEELELAVVRDLIQLRGADTWVMSLDLEMEVGIERATKEELIRIIKRYALLLKKRSSLLAETTQKKPKPKIDEEPVAVVEDKMIEPEIEPEIEVEEEAEESIEGDLEESLEVEPDEELDEIDETISEDLVIEQESDEIETPDELEEELLDEEIIGEETIDEDIDDVSDEPETSDTESNLDELAVEEEIQEIDELETESIEDDLEDFEIKKVSEEEETIRELFGSGSEDLQTEDLQLNEDLDNIRFDDITTEEPIELDDSKKVDFDIEFEEQDIDLDNISLEELDIEEEVLSEESDEVDFDTEIEEEEDLDLDEITLEELDIEEEVFSEEPGVDETVDTFEDTDLLEEDGLDEFESELSELEDEITQEAENISTDELIEEPVESEEHIEEEEKLEILEDKLEMEIEAGEEALGDEVPVQSEVEEIEQEIEEYKDVQLTPEEEDHFAELRKGPFHDRLVNEMYGGKANLMDVFITKVAGAPDWNRAKQYIANELFRYRIDLNSDLGEKFYIVLKRCLGE